MEYFAGLDISMDETHVCVLNREGVIAHEEKTVTTPQAIAASLAKAPACRRVVFETGRMALTGQAQRQKTELVRAAPEFRVRVLRTRPGMTGQTTPPLRAAAAARCARRRT